MPRATSPQLVAGKRSSIERKVQALELVPNEPFRERVEFLLAHDPDFSLVTVCHRLADLGYTSYLKTKSGTSRGWRPTGDTSHLQRNLGMRDQTASRKNGRAYRPPQRTKYIRYDLAVALCRALDMDFTDVGV